MLQNLRYIRQELGEHYSQSERSTLARIILEEVSGLTFADITSGKSSNLSVSQSRKMKQIIARLKNGEPFQYVLGKTTFYGLDFVVGREVLIPRPETEELVEWIIDDNGAKPITILDIGTGSGWIDIALAANILNASVHGWDISAAALKMAEENAHRNKVQLFFTQQNLFDPVPAAPQFDLIVSNPPYITESERETMDSTVTDHEPEEALFVPDSDPLLFYKRIASLAEGLLNEGGRLFFEIHRSRGAEVCTMLQEKCFREIELRRDLSG